ncbi:hypothetical protein [Brevibacillus borstelensis]|uniref:hypothetical protein n=1 Tax=Brevibacillus borstelensis TaxID=45462 RepID=UPI002042535C|nr:hypothetical protein [Brevibacillus borstelensis]MCM3468786.1 hypothetical protein [Brevibacillus borstelensis]MCM3590007.1 hypothetical protein [Brevibacillus borstelensis]
MQNRPEAAIVAVPGGLFVITDCIWQRRENCEEKIYDKFYCLYSYDYFFFNKFASKIIYVFIYRFTNPFISGRNLLLYICLRIHEERKGIDEFDRGIESRRAFATVRYTPSPLCPPYPYFTKHPLCTARIAAKYPQDL